MTVTRNKFFFFFDYVVYFSVFSENVFEFNILEITMYVVIIIFSVFNEDVFECNVKEIGCAQMCSDEYNKFSFPRFWVFQVCLKKHDK